MNHRSFVSLALLSCSMVALGACRSSAPAERPSESIAPPAAQGASNEDAASAPEAAVEPPDASAAPEDSGAPSRTPSPMERKLREMAASDEAFAAGISSARGLVVVRYLEAPPSGRGRETRTSERVCPAQLTRRAGELRALLVRALARADEAQDVVCDGDECRIPGMEYEESRVFTFSVGDGGAMTLSAMRFVSEAAMPQRWIDEANAFHRSNVERLQRTPCPAR